MATSSTYYLNAPSLESATAVFSDADLLVLAADGFYSDGVISRQQVGGVLLPQQLCIPPSGSASLAWSYTISGGATGTMDLYINSVLTENVNFNASGTILLSVGDTINVEISTSGCSGGTDKANAYCTGIINESSCADGVTGLISSVYTVVSGDLGEVLVLDTISLCDTVCV